MPLFHEDYPLKASKAYDGSLDTVHRREVRRPRVPPLNLQAIHGRSGACVPLQTVSPYDSEATTACSGDSSRADVECGIESDPLDSFFCWFAERDDLETTEGLEETPGRCEEGQPRPREERLSYLSSQTLLEQLDFAPCFGEDQQSTMEYSRSSTGKSFESMENKSSVLSKSSSALKVSPWRAKLEKEAFLLNLIPERSGLQH
eukprot:CAMPEP_0206462462 /NCGR_PEP_ID=MMETSP0324_2-20121206/25995_1 /ASSEMBLY_ACC=CAM_ASM_000836 /TAXON_ID=2866 /ORGANISM="Crypthecodinium cohnii, Strain Seligo" /LENGTH=202 /DNA_ID=CAMNT_0053934627 /DNA_START=67 /DNA_END=675 /DNA_ORIENTATION=+